jgi:hypothetical protein
MTRLSRLGAAGLALAVGLGLLAGCTSDDSEPYVDKGVPTGSYRLVAFDTCDDALRGLRDATKATVGPYGLFGNVVMEDSVGAVPPALPRAEPNNAKGDAAMTGSGAGAGTPEYSGTNNHEAGVDEPDLVKTDGRRIVTVVNGMLRVVDATTRRVTGSVRIDSQGFGAMDLLLAGDHALVLLNRGYAMDPMVRGRTDARLAAPMGPRLVLVGLAGEPRVLSSAEVDGGLVDARQVGNTARVVVKSFPRIAFDIEGTKTDSQRLADNRALIDQTPIDAWLPRVWVTTDGVRRPMAVDCGAISRPSVYSGANLLTILTYNLSGDTLDDGKPTTLVADGDTVYGNGASLYVTNDQRWQARTMLNGDVATTPQQGRTEIYKFDTSTSDRARFVAGGSVPGYLINQYSLSEWDGKLRVATTTGQGGRATQSGVYVLTPDDKSLNLVGKVEGLGKGERIYAVRFTGPIGYVVTFRQTDPLYTVDLRDPARPTVRGELKIAGYSAYLHPAEPGRLIGIGQDATDQGRVTGTQVSLFNISDLSAPGRLAQFTLPGGHSEAEYDPHAFLYWAADGLLVVPVSDRSTAQAGALVLQVSGSSIREIGLITHPETMIRRSLIIDKTLWTVSDRGVMANDSRTLSRLAWIPFY